MRGRKEGKEGQERTEKGQRSAISKISGVISVEINLLSEKKHICFFKVVNSVAIIYEWQLEHIIPYLLFLTELFASLISISITENNLDIGWFYPLKWVILPINLD